MIKLQIQHQAPVNNDNNDNSQLLEQLNIKNEFEDQKFKYEQSPIRYRSIRRKCTTGTKEVKELQIEIEKKENEFEQQMQKLNSSS